MVRIENPISWLQSKKAISDNPISWLSPKRHYAEFRETVSGISREELEAERARYSHNTRNKLTITGLALAAELGGAAIVAPHVDPVVLLISAGPMALVPSFIGLTRGILRDVEKGILQEEIERRQGATGETVFPASEKA